MTLLETFFNWEVLVRTMPVLIRGVGTTILLGFASIFFGTVLGLGVSLVRLYAIAPVRIAAMIYIDVFRALPMLVVLIVVYYALPFVGIRFDSWTSAILSFSLVLAAYSAEVFRAGIEAMPRGQFEAAASLGLHFIMTLRKVVLPQALRMRGSADHVELSFRCSRTPRWPRSSPCPSFSRRRRTRRR